VLSDKLVILGGFALDNPSIPCERRPRSTLAPLALVQ